MSEWVLQGLRTGIKTTHYPDARERAPGVSPGRPVGGSYPADQAEALLARCPTGALRYQDGQVIIDYRRCVHCFRCARELKTPLTWEMDYEWAGANTPGLTGPFGRSVHILVVDTGDCGACLNEVKQLNNPYYNMHRLGFFITPTPRQADILLVVGALSAPMREPLLQAYQAMPNPKRVVAVGACALSGSLFGPSFACGTGVSELLPVAVEVPGQPPPPLAILHGLLVAVGRRPAVPLSSPNLPMPIPVIEEVHSRP